MVGLVIGAIVAGILGAIALGSGKKTGIGAEHPTALEFKEFIEERAKAFLSTQDLDTLVQFVPEENRAEFSAKLLSFLQAIVESSTATGLSVLLKIENIERMQSSVLQKSTETLAKSTETLNRLDKVKDTIAAVSDLSDNLAANRRYAQRIYEVSQLIRGNLTGCGKKPIHL